MRKHYKNLLVSGCSFSSDGIGGNPPTATSEGGCSFALDPDRNVPNPNSWVGFLAQRLNVTSLVNTAAGGHGNILIANSLMELLLNYRYNALDTLVVFNITDPSRFDLPCNFDHPEVSKHIPWTRDLIPYSYLNRFGPAMSEFKTTIGYDQVERITTNAIFGLLSVLKNMDIDFCFLTMNDYSETCLDPVIEKFEQHLVKLSPGSNMVHFATATNTILSANDFHPTVHGHKLIADQIYNFINQ